MKITEFVGFFDFSYKKYPDGYGLIDLQGANLGDIEQERFSSVSEIVGRFVDSIYIPDYIESSLKEHGYEGDHSYEDMHKWCMENNHPYAEILAVLENPDSIEKD